MTALAAEGRRAGRFELKRLLGRGAQASVWLAHDPRLQRDVALKLLGSGADAADIDTWMHQARAVSRLQHPNIVPVFEANNLDGEPCLVFEHVEGGTLADAILRDGAMAPRRAVELMLGVLAALVEAHAHGIVHRDLKPSNVLLGFDGRARVMDFGIAARVSGAADGRIMGTPGYLSPEAARGEAPSPGMDVFSTGVLLAELLSGRRLLPEGDPRAALHRVQNEDLTWQAGFEVDDPLRSLVQRALARDPALRHDSAAAFRDALAAWLRAGSATAAVDAGTSNGNATLDFLLRRMRHKADFPALGAAVLRIQRSASSDTESLASLSTEILKDVALTNKLLRLVNSARFGHAGGGSIGTVSRAVALIGFAGVRNLALSLVLLDHMQDRQHATQMKEEFLRALMAGTLAGALAPLARESEEVFIAALFQNLGRLLTEFYFSEEAQQIHQLRDQGVGADEAAQRVLGIGWQDLAQGVAKVWGLPDSLQRAMRAPDGEVPTRRADPGIERSRWIGRCANELTDTLLCHDADRAQAAVAARAERYARALGVPARAIVDASTQAQERLLDFARAMGVDVAHETPVRRLFPDGASPDGVATDILVLSDAAAAGRKAEAVSHALTAGIAEVTDRMVSGDFKLNEVLHQVLETMYRALDLQRIVFCLRDARTDCMTGRLALGLGGQGACKPFVIPLREPPGAAVDLFAAVCRKGADTVIADTGRGGMANRLPAWYLEGVNAPSFLLLPLMLRNAPFGLIYADVAQAGGLAPEEKELALLRALRNQVVMAFRQVGV
ncbi:MAG: HDOD domain-containing protein [Rubrivivax sp.]|nr:HDOD domain-containing protein [Rubrivivax sp.]MBK8526715.1 HDOD domain-containing protein [Rubrivivax sp.]